MIDACALAHQPISTIASFTSPHRPPSVIIIIIIIIITVVITAVISIIALQRSITLPSTDVAYKMRQWSRVNGTTDSQLVFTERRYASAVYAVVVYLFVCLKPVLYQNG